MIIGTALNAEEIANISGKWKDILFVLFDLLSMSLRDKKNLKNGPFSCVKNFQPLTLRARGGGLVSRALDSNKGSEFETLRIGVSVLCSPARYFTLTVSLSFNLGGQMDTYETLGKLEELCGL